MPISHPRTGSQTVVPVDPMIRKYSIEQRFFNSNGEVLGNFWGFMVMDHNRLNTAVRYRHYLMKISPTAFFKLKTKILQGVNDEKPIPVLP